METMTIAVQGHEITLEIVQDGTSGWAVNLPQFDLCAGTIGPAAPGPAGAVYSVEPADIFLVESDHADKWDALAAIQAGISNWLEERDVDSLPRDPADAEEQARELLDPVVSSRYSSAAVRDVCRRAAWDMGIRNRDAHPDLLPSIARAAADRLEEESGPYMARIFLEACRARLASAGWKSLNGTSYSHGDNTVTLSNPGTDTLEMAFWGPGQEGEQFRFNRKQSSPARVAAVAAALTTK